MSAGEGGDPLGRRGVHIRNALMLVAGFLLLAFGLGTLVQSLHMVFGPANSGGAAPGLAFAILPYRISASLFALVAGGLLLLFRSRLRSFDGSVRFLSDALKAHGRDLPPQSGEWGAAQAVAARLERYRHDLEEARRTGSREQEARIAELSQAHRDLLDHHRITKRMLRSLHPDEVFQSLIQGIREGLGFRGAVLGILAPDGNLLFRGEVPGEGGEPVRIPVWEEESLLARVLWGGNPLLVPDPHSHRHLPEDRRVLGDGPAFLAPVLRDPGRKCSEAKNCGEFECPAYHGKNPRCWLQRAGGCGEIGFREPGDRRRECALCPQFGGTALVVVRQLPEGREVSPETVRPVATMVAEASLAIEIVEMYESLRRLSVTDGLTGLLNHREFYHVLGRELERARRYRHPVSLMMIDVDDFKAFNDRYGHLAGDQALRKVAALLRGCVRSTDFAARYGGEEFAVILPESPESGALMLAERIRNEIGSHRFVGSDPEGVGLTVSIGIYTADGGQATENQIVGLADEAAYLAKASGKNRVVVKQHA